MFWARALGRKQVSRVMANRVALKSIMGVS